MEIDVPVINGLSRDQVLTLAHCRTLPQYIGMIESYLARKCVFCDPLDPIKNQIIHENVLWRMWVNPFPLKHTQAHFILASRRHIGPQEGLTARDFSAIGELFLWAQQELKLPGGGLVMRYGPPEQNAGTVLHLHANIIVPDGTGEVRIPLAKDPGKMIEIITRMHAFEKLRHGVSADQLTPEEKRLVEGRFSL